MGNFERHVPDVVHLRIHSPVSPVFGCGGESEPHRSNRPGRQTIKKESTEAEVSCHEVRCHVPPEGSTQRTAKPTRKRIGDSDGCCVEHLVRDFDDLADLQARSTGGREGRREEARACMSKCLHEHGAGAVANAQQTIQATPCPRRPHS